MNEQIALTGTSMRAKEIVEKYQQVLLAHMEDLRAGRAEKTFEIQDIIYSEKRCNFGNE